MSDPGSGPDLLNELANDFAERYRRGERPGLTEYTGKYPDLAAEIRDLFPAMAVIEELGSVVAGPTGPQSKTATSDGAALRQLGEYRILREVARGGMGIIYEAIQESLGRHVALKVLPFQSLADARQLERFRREARAAAMLHHTNIVPVFGVGEDNGVHYFAMQFIRGQALDSILHELRCRRRAELNARRDFADETAPVSGGKGSSDLTVTLGGALMTGRFPVDPGERESRDDPGEEQPPRVVWAGRTPDGSGDAATEVFGTRSGWDSRSDMPYFRSVARVGLQVAEALAYAHGQGVLHRDVKPANILLDTEGTAWVTDFGLAKADGSGDLTSPGDLVGTLRYMAPERFRGLSDPRSDVFSLGLTLYEMATLRPAFAAPERAQLILRMLHAEPPRPRAIDRRIPRDLETLILKSIAKEPERRYQTAGELAEDLQRFLADRPIQARRSNMAEQLVRWCRRNPWLAGANIAAAVLTTMLAIGSTLAAWNFRDQRDQNGRNLGLIRAAETKGRERLFESLTAQASAKRHSRKVGQRFDSLNAIAQAATIAHELKLPAQRLDTLRDDAIACMALPDMQPTGRVIRRPPGVIAATFDSTITRYALRFRDGAIQVRRVADDEVIARFSARGDRDTWIRLSPDGRYLATGDFPSAALTVWDIEQGTVCLNDPTPFGVRFSPDSRSFALAHLDGDLLVYDLATGHPSTLLHGSRPANDLAYRPDGAQVAIIYNGKEPCCQIVGAGSGQLVRSIPLPTSAAGIAWSADGTTLVTPCNDRKIYLWDAATGTQRATLEGSNDFGSHAAFHPAGTLLASNDGEGQLRLGDAVLGRAVLSLSGGGLLEFSKDGRIVVEFEDRWTSYQVNPALEYRTFAQVSSQRMDYRGASIRRDGRVLALGTTWGVELWDLAHGKGLGFLPIGRVDRAFFEASGDLLTDGWVGVRRWPVQLDSDRGEFRIGPPRPLLLPVADCGIAGDRRGRIVAIPDHDFAFVATPERTIHLGPLDDCRNVAVSPSGEWLATGNHVATKGAQVWRIRDATKVADLPIDYGTGLIFSPDEKWLMTTDPPCRLWAVGTWREARQIGGKGHCFSPDGRLLVVVDATKVICLVETETGRTLARLESPDLCRAQAASFSPDGSRLVVTTNDGPALHIWDLRAIRRRLSQMRLDWAAPAYRDDDRADRSAPALPRLQVDLGPLPLTPYIEPSLYEPVIAELEAAMARQPEPPGVRWRLTLRCNDYAWSLVKAPDSLRDPERALTLARRALELAPDQAFFVNTLGVAQYRAGRYAEAIATLERRLTVGYGANDAYDLFFQAMAHWRLGDKPQALTCFDKAVEWTQKNMPANEELNRFRTEAAALLNVKEKTN